ncbi:MAG: S26 family signal peptidase [Steroidobacteraceae bacterium]
MSRNPKGPHGGHVTPRRGRHRRVKVLVELLLIVGCAEWVASHPRYCLVFDFDAPIGEHCLRYSSFFVDERDHVIRRGDYVAFLARGMTPFYPDGTRVVKEVAGVSGDHVVVNSLGVWVNEVQRGTLPHAQVGGRLWRMGRRPEDFERDERVPAHRWWVMGTSLHSFDSRYWGYISDEQVIGRARPLW